MKIELVRHRLPGSPIRGFSSISFTRALPFYLSARGTKIHRVRAGEIVMRSGQFRHAYVQFLCGNSGFLGSKGSLIGVPKEGFELCRLCEEKVNRGKGVFQKCF
jgi:hypothetical protein